MHRDFPGSPVVKTGLPMQGVRVQSLMEDLRSRMPRGVAQNKTNGCILISQFWLRLLLESQI